MRKCTIEDVDWLMSLGEKMYGTLLQNHEKTRQWVVSSLSNDNALIIRSDNAAMMVFVSSMPFHDKSNASAFLFAGKGREVIRLFRMAAAWCKEKGVDKLHFRSTTEHDITKLAKIIGAKVEYPAYSLEL